MGLLRCEDVALRYGRGPDVVRGVSVTFTPGVWAVIGPNGAGKSTLLRACAGLHPVGAGRIRVNGRPWRTVRAPERTELVAYVAQRPTIWSGFTVRDVVAMGRYALPASDHAIDGALERVGLADRSADRFLSLSVGQQQRVTLARALAQLHGRPDALLIADEPVSAQDPAHVGVVLRLLREHASMGGGVLVALHDTTNAVRVADSALLLDRKGCARASGPADEVLTDEHLEEVFGVGFDRISTGGGPALIARTLPDARPNG